MAIEYVTARFSKPGKGFPQVPLTNADGTPVMEDGKQKIGNEQFDCKQLSDESIDSSDPSQFLADVLETANSDLAFAAECYREGWNRLTRLRSAGLDEYQKAAKGVMKLGLPWTKGLSVDQVAEKLKAMNS